MMKTIVLCIAVVMVAGCERLSDDAIATRAEIRHALFVECVTLASEIKRTGDDDVSDIISKCDDVSFYISQNLKSLKGRPDARETD